MYIQGCYTHLPSRIVSKLASLELRLQQIIYHRQSNILSLHGFLGSSPYSRSYHQSDGHIPDSRTPQSDGHIPDSRTPDQCSLPLHLSAKRIYTYSHSSPTVLSHKLFANENSQCQREHSKSHRNSHTKSKHQTLATHIIKLIASLSLSYATYKIVNNIFEQFDLLPTASCISQEPNLNPDPNLTQSTKLESNCLQLPSSKPILRNATDQKKIGTEENEFSKVSLQAAIEKAQRLCIRRKEEVGSPGIVVCVSIDGKQVYAEGFGYADVENQIPLKPNSVLRIASISKAITAIIVAKAWEKGQIDIEKTVQHYVPSFPHKEFMGEKVEITVRQLLSHSSGIRHYKPKDDPVYAFDKSIAGLVGVVKDASLLPFYKTGPGQTKKLSDDIVGENQVQNSKQKKAAEVTEMDRDEYYLTKHFSATEESLALFANDPLVARPGTKYVYTTFAYTLLAAVIEAALKTPFTEIVTKTLQQMGLKETYLDLNEPIIYNRARYYVKDARGRVVNSRYVDNSYKWAGGGMLSTVEDMVKFGNILLYSAQHEDEDPGPPGFLKSSSIWKFWTPQGIKGASRTYGLGFSIRPAVKHMGMCGHIDFGVGHTGAAIGVSSALFILPRQYPNQKSMDDNSQKLQGKVSLQTVKNSANPYKPTTSSTCKTKSNVDKESETIVPEKNMCDQTSKPVAGQPPHGIVVCVMLNMISVSLKDVAEDIARAFENVDFTL